MAGKLAFRFGLEITTVWPSRAKSASLWLAPGRAWATSRLSLKATNQMAPEALDSLPRAGSLWCSPSVTEGPRPN